MASTLSSLCTSLTLSIGISHLLQIEELKASPCTQCISRTHQTYKSCKDTTIDAEAKCSTITFGLGVDPRSSLLGEHAGCQWRMLLPYVCRAARSWGGVSAFSNGVASLAKINLLCLKLLAAMFDTAMKPPPWEPCSHSANIMQGLLRLDLWYCSEQGLRQPCSHHHRLQGVLGGRAECNLADLGEGAQTKSWQPSWPG